MPHHLPASHAAALSAACVSAACCWASPASARCETFRAAGVPVFTCTRGHAGGFLASEGGQPSIIASRLDDPDGPVLAVSRDYGMGVRVGPWTPSMDFHLMLRLDGAGPLRGKLTAEFCGSDPVAVTFLNGTPSRLQSCGDRMVVMDGVEWPGMTTDVVD